MENGLITFFQVTECGFYRLKADENKPNRKVSHYVKGSLEESLNLVMDWVKGRDFSQTIPWDVASNPNRTKVYFKDVYKDEDSGDTLIVFCKALTNEKGDLSGFVEDAKVGDVKNDVVQVSNKVKGQKLIYALPMYYWFIPSLNIIASIKFPHSLASTTSISEYIKRCIDNFAPSTNRKVSNSTVHNSFLKQDINVKRVSYESDCKKFSMSYKMEAVLKELSIKEVSLKQLAKEITHIVVRDTISSSKELEANVLFDLWNKITKKQGRIRQKNHVEIVTEVHLDPQKLADVLAVYDEENPINTDWTNVGFRTGNDDTTKWFDSYVDRKHIQLDPILKRENSYFPAQTILDVLLLDRKELLNFIEGEDNDDDALIAVGEN